MTNKQVQELLKQYPDETPIKLLINPSSKKYYDFDETSIMESSETALINDEAPEDEWDCEDGKFELGNGQRFLLINPIIL